MTVEDFKRDGLWVKTTRVDKKPAYTYSFQRWHNMNSRCLKGGAEQLRNQRYVGCSTSNNFKSFQYFTEWHREQIGYGLFDYHLDKDFLLPKNRIYSEESCVLLPAKLNKFLCLNAQCRGESPIGVSKARNGYFQSHLTFDSVVHCLGQFRTKEETGNAYIVAKNKAIKSWADKIEAGEFGVDGRVLERLNTMSIEDYL